MEKIYPVFKMRLNAIVFMAALISITGLILISQCGLDFFDFAVAFIS